jgi:hypothetical protein
MQLVIGMYKNRKPVLKIIFNTNAASCANA